MSCNTLTPTENTNTGAAESTRYLTPAADFFGDAAGTRVVLDLPGVAQSDLAVTVDDQRLTIVGRRKKTEATGERLHREIRPFDYRRVFTLDASIDTSRIQADLRDGVLTLQLPTAEKVKPRRIEVA